MNNDEYKKYYSEEETITAIKNIEGRTDLTSDETSMEDAMEFCKKIMYILIGSENVQFTDEGRKSLSNALREKGACRFSEAADKFLVENDKCLGDMMSEKSILFPLSAFSELIEKPQDSFNYGFSKITLGGKESSWGGRWLRFQENGYENGEIYFSNGQAYRYIDKNSMEQQFFL